MKIYYESELYHYGVKGMKWGKRKAKMEAKVARRYSRAGKDLGRADYYRKKGDDAASRYLVDAATLDTKAKEWDRDGHTIAADVMRKRAQELKNKAAEARRQYDEQADYYVRSAEKSKQKAKDYATKKRVSLGKSVIDKVMGESRAKGEASEEFLDDFSRQQEAATQRRKQQDDAWFAEQRRKTMEMMR